MTARNITKEPHRPGFFTRVCASEDFANFIFNLIGGFFDVFFNVVACEIIGGIFEAIITGIF